MDAVRPTAETVSRTLRAATERFGETWQDVRFVARDSAERGDRILVVPERTLSWAEVPAAPGYRFVPYGVRQHTLVVGFAAAEEGIAVDDSRFARRTW